jgi:hypothetical protein
MQRPTHVASWDLEDLIAASLACCAGAQAITPTPTPGGSDVAPPRTEAPREPVITPGGTDIQGPRVREAEFDATAGTLTLSFDKPISEASIRDQLQVAAFDSGWAKLRVRKLEAAADGLSVSARFDTPSATATVVRVRFGHNDPPVIGVDGWPLAGAVDEPSPLPQHGRAYVRNFPRSAT